MDPFSVDEELVQAITSASGGPGRFSVTPSGLSPYIAFVGTPTVSVSVPSIITVTVISMGHGKKGSSSIQGWEGTNPSGLHKGTVSRRVADTPIRM